VKINRNAKLGFNFYHGVIYEGSANQYTIKNLISYNLLLKRAFGCWLQALCLCVSVVKDFSPQRHRDTEAQRKQFIHPIQRSFDIMVGGVCRINYVVASGLPYFSILYYHTHGH
jgi:hypothetical protein